MKKIDITEAVGLELAYDITEVDPVKQVKRRAFKRGHIIQQEDLDYLRRLGRRTIFVSDGNEAEMHEDDAAKTVAPLAAGDNIRFNSEPVEGKINFKAAADGVFRVDKERLKQINSLKIPSLPTIHDRFPVTEGYLVGAFRIIPLTCDPSVIGKVKEILAEPVMKVVPYKLKKAGILVTGTEVYEGRIKDGFIPKLTKKLEAFGLEIAETDIVPDDFDRIKERLEAMIKNVDIVLTTGGTSVDPDDVTADAMRAAGVMFESKGNPIQPGNNLTIGYAGDVPVCAVPAAALFFRATALDIFLPSLLAGERVTDEEISESGHGGLCHFCKKCVYPVCPFGRGV